MCALIIKINQSIFFTGKETNQQYFNKSKKSFKFFENCLRSPKPLLNFFYNINIALSFIK